LWLPVHRVLKATRDIVLFGRDPAQGTLHYMGMVAELEGAASVVWRTYATRGQ
jgi:hypothetical protein